MSDSARAWRFLVGDMIRFAERVLTYTRGMDQAAFLADTRTYDATMRNIELLGEVASQLPAEVRQQHPDIPWRQMSETRNRLIHAYAGIDDDVVWSIIRDDIAPLLEQLRAIDRDPD